MCVDVDHGNVGHVCFTCVLHQWFVRNLEMYFIPELTHQAKKNPNKTLPFPCVCKSNDSLNLLKKFLNFAFIIELELESIKRFGIRTDKM